MPNNQKISVIIPTFNRAGELIRAVKSALSQTYPVFEIIVCDDGSTDNSHQLINELNNPKVIWLDCGKNGGPAIPRNAGIKYSKGNWLAFLDSDDEWLPKKIEKQMLVIEAAKVKTACCNANRIRGNVNAGLYSDFKNDLVTFNDFLIGNYVICSSVLISKEFVLNTSFFPEEKKFIAIEDYALWLRLSVSSNFVFLNEALVNYSDSSETSIRTKYTDNWIILEIIFSDFKKWIKKSKFKLSTENEEALKLTLKKIKTRGLPTEFEILKGKVVGKIKSVFNSKTPKHD